MTSKADTIEEFHALAVERVCRFGQDMMPPKLSSRVWLGCGCVHLSIKTNYCNTSRPNFPMISTDVLDSDGQCDMTFGLYVVQQRFWERIPESMSQRLNALCLPSYKDRCPSDLGPGLKYAQ